MIAPDNRNGLCFFGGAECPDPATEPCERSNGMVWICPPCREGERASIASDAVMTRELTREYAVYLGRLRAARARFRVVRS